MKAGIVGLGLIGGSLGLDLQDRKIVDKVVGVDHNLAHCEEALSLGLVNDIVTMEEIKKCDLIFLAIPVNAIVDLLPSLKDVDEKNTIIDLGSTKKRIVDATPKEIVKNFVAAHPMAGTEKFGPTAAFKGLFDNHTVVLCDTERNDEFHKNRAIDLFKKLNMKIYYMNAKEHDRHASFISHLPHAISYSLANAVMSQEDPRSILAMAAGGFKDMSRVAKSSPKMWSDVFKQNRENLLSSIEIFEKELGKVKELMEHENWEALEIWMQKATTLHKIL
ncbi:MAG: prephenate dehydrogenase [Epsilonproteobacteria bacterium]|nr:prephenate dehydrogenase [Campylobacterota bacterium]